jgi:hypothetical protein
MRYIFAISALLFMLSLMLPSLRLELDCGDLNVSASVDDEIYAEARNADADFRGWELLAFGGFSLLFLNLGAVGWLANFFYFGFMIVGMTKGFAAARQWLGAATVLCLAALPMMMIAPLPADEGVVCVFLIAEINPGFWFWTAAILIPWYLQFRRSSSCLRKQW